MNVSSWLLWGSVSTLVLTVAMIAAQGVGITRINIPYLLGSMFTPDRDRAKVAGFAVHFANGLVFSLGYAWIFDELHRATAWLGALVGLAHGVIALVLVSYLLPGIHPRMASEQRGPTVVRRLEPPGFFAIHYGYQTPVSVIVAHVVFGALLGGLYHLP